VAGVSGQLYASSHRKQLSEKYLCHVQQKQLWQETEQALERWLK
jgi:putative oxidoreductase